MSKQTPEKRVLFVRRFTPVLLAFFGVFSLVLTNLHVPNMAYATTSNTINFQARLQTAAGAIVPDGDYNIEFKLYNASTSSGSSQGSCSGDSNCLWTETRTSTDKVTVINGYLSVNLGSVTAFPTTIDWSQPLWLTMNIGGTGSATWDGEMNPRMLLTAVPYAFQAGSATQAGELSSTNSNGTSTLTFQGSGSGHGDQNFVIQDQGAAGTYNLLTKNVADSSYLQLQSSTPGTAQTGNLNITGTALVGGASISGNLLMTGSSSTISNPQSSTGGEAFGAGATVGSTSGSTALGNGATASGNDTVVVGSGAAAASSQSIAIGVNAATSGAASIAIGHGAATTAANQLVIGGASGSSQQITDAYIGSGVTDSSPSNITVHATGGSGSNIAGGTINIAGGTGTGTGNGGSINLQIAKPGTTGSAANSLSTVASWSGIDGSALFKNAADSTSGFAVQNANGVSVLTVDTSGSNVTIGSGGTFTNNGGTLNTALALTDLATGGSIGSASSTVDTYTAITVDQTTASQTLTVPSPTDTTAGRVVYISNIGSASFTLLGSPIGANVTATLVWNGTAWTFAGADGSSILNQTSSTQTAGFNINGTGTAGTLQASTFDAASAGTLDVGTTNATAITVGTTSSTTTTITVGQSTASNTINVGNAAVTGTQTINIGTGSTGSGKNNVTIGSTNDGSATTINGGTGNITLNTNSSAASVIIKSNTNSATAFQVNSSSSNILNVDTTGSAAVSVSAGNFTVQNASGTDLLTADTGSTLIDDPMTTTPTGTLAGSASYVSGQYVELNNGGPGNDGEIGYTQSTVTGNFDAKFNFWSVSGGKDGTWLFVDDTSVPSSYHFGTGNGGYDFAYSDANSDAELYFNGVLLASAPISAPNNSTWHTAEVTRDGNTFTMYYDGNAVLNYTDTARTLTGTKLGIGGCSCSQAGEHRTKNFTFQSGLTSIAITGTLGVTTTSANALQVQNGSGTNFFTVDTADEKVIIGPSAGDTTGPLLVLGNKTNTGDPTEVDGAMYYNSAADAFRCGVNGAWINCVNGKATQVETYRGTETALSAKAANATILLVPIYIPGQITVNQMRIHVTATLGAAGDVGLYNAAGTLVLNGGSSSLTTATGLQTVTPTQAAASRVLEAGQYYAAVTWNSTTGIVSGTALSTSGDIAQVGTLTGGGLVLPSTITPGSITAGTQMVYISFNN